MNTPMSKKKIDEIAQAELRAEEIRTSASQSARDALAAAKAEAAERLAAQEKDEREKTLAALAQAELEGEALGRSLRAEMEQAAESQCASAEKRISEAVDYLVKKVLETA